MFIYILDTLDIDIGVGGVGSILYLPSHADIRGLLFPIPLWIGWSICFSALDGRTVRFSAFRMSMRSARSLNWQDVSLANFLCWAHLLPIMSDA